MKKECITVVVPLEIEAGSEDDDNKISATELSEASQGSLDDAVKACCFDEGGSWEVHSREIIRLDDGILISYVLVRDYIETDAAEHCPHP